MDVATVSAFSNMDPTTAVMFFYLLFRLENLNKEIKEIKEELGIRKKGKGKVSFFLEQLKNSWNGTQ